MPPVEERSGSGEGGMMILVCRCGAGDRIVIMDELMLVSVVGDGGRRASDGSDGDA